MRYHLDEPHGIFADDKDLIAAGLRPLIAELGEAHVFVTGGTGFFGRWLLESLAVANERLAARIRATVLSRTPASFAATMPHLAAKPWLRFVQGDVLSYCGAPDSYTHVLHAATPASASMAANDPLLMVDTVVTGTRRILDFAVACEARHVLFTSSGAVYGTQPPSLTHVDESCRLAPDCLDPKLSYHEAKRLAETICCAYAERHGLEVKIARCFAFVGPHLPLDAHFAIGNFIRDALAGGPIHIKGDGTPLRSYLYAADLAVWLWTLFARGRSQTAYNVGSEDAVSIADVAQVVARAFSPSPAVHIEQACRNDTPPARYVPSTRRARSELGVACTVDLAEAVARTVAWYGPRQPSSR